MSNDDVLTARFGRIKGGSDFIASGPRPDTALIFNVFGDGRFRPGSYEKDISFLDELRVRGYDIKTIKFSIKKIKPAKQPNLPFSGPASEPAKHKGV